MAQVQNEDLEICFIHGYHQLDTAVPVRGSINIIQVKRVPDFQDIFRMSDFEIIIFVKFRS